MTDRLFVWEREPFSRCAKCDRETFGFLSGGGHSIVWRCSTCGYSLDEPLPDVDKKVIYLDQFAFSELFKLKAGTRREDKLTAFWEEVNALRRVILGTRASQALEERLRSILGALFPECQLTRMHADRTTASLIELPVQ